MDVRPTCPPSLTHSPPVLFGVAVTAPFRSADEVLMHRVKGGSPFLLVQGAMLVLLGGPRLGCFRLIVRGVPLSARPAAQRDGSHGSHGLRTEGRIPPVGILFADAAHLGMPVGACGVHVRFTGWDEGRQAPELHSDAYSRAQFLPTCVGTRCNGQPRRCHRREGACHLVRDFLTCIPSSIGSAMPCQPWWGIFRHCRPYGVDRSHDTLFP